MYFIIIGCGRLGSSIARDLSLKGHNIVIIDEVANNLDRLGSGFNGQKIKGIGFDIDTLVQAGIEHTDVFFALTQDDNKNIMASQVAKHLYHVPKVIARINEPNKEFIYQELGIESVSLTHLGTELFESKVTKKSRNIENLDYNFRVADIYIESERYKTVEEIEQKYNCLISAILQDGVYQLAKKENKVRVGDRIICTIGKKNLEKLVLNLSKEILI